MPAIFPGNDLMDPGVDGRRPHSAIGKQADTVGHLVPHSADGFEFLKQFRVGQGGQSGQIHLSRQDLGNGVLDVGHPVSQLAGGQVPRLRPRQLFRRGEGVQCFVGSGDRLAEPFSQQLHRLLDGRDAFALRNDKRHQHFPGILPQNPDAAAFLCRQLHIGVRLRDDFLYSGIRSPQIEVGPPYPLPGFLGAAHCKAPGRLPEVQHLPPRDKAEGSILKFFYPETLSAAGDFGKVKVVGNGDMHGRNSLVFLWGMPLPFPLGNPARRRYFPPSVCSGV